MSKLKGALEMLCEWETSTSENEEYSGNADVWYGKVKWFDDKHFYGYAADGEVEDHNMLLVTHFICGVFSEGLGITVIKISQNPNVAPMLFRGAPNSEGKYSGDFYAVQPATITFGNPFTGQMGGLKKIIYEKVGRASFAVDKSQVSFPDHLAIEELNHIAKVGLQDDFCSGIVSRYDSEDCIREMLDDLEENVYPYETGDVYLGEQSSKNQKI